MASVAALMAPISFASAPATPMTARARDGSAGPSRGSRVSRETSNFQLESIWWWRKLAGDAQIHMLRRCGLEKRRGSNGPGRLRERRIECDSSLYGAALDNRSSRAGFTIASVVRLSDVVVRSTAWRLRRTICN